MAVVRSLRLLTSRKVADHPPVVVAIDATAPDEDHLAIPSDVKTVFLGGLFALAALAGCYFAAEIALPIVLAFVLSLVLQPTMRQLERRYLPRGIAALLIILVLFGTLARSGTALSGPAASWAQELPSGVPKLRERLSFLSRPLVAVENFADQAQGLTQGDQPKAVAVALQGSALSNRLLSGTRSPAGSSRRFWYSSSCSSAGTPSFAALSKSCRGSKTSDRRSRSSSKSSAMCQPTCLQLRS
jgi:hypothetical protein